MSAKYQKRFWELFKKTGRWLGMSVLQSPVLSFQRLKNVVVVAGSPLHLGNLGP